MEVGSKVDLKLKADTPYVDLLGIFAKLLYSLVDNNVDGLSGDQTMFAIFCHKHRKIMVSSKSWLPVGYNLALWLTTHKFTVMSVFQKDGYHTCKYVSSKIGHHVLSSATYSLSFADNKNRNESESRRSLSQWDLNYRTLSPVQKDFSIRYAF